MIMVLIVLAVILLVGMWLAGAYNNLIGLRNRVKNAWAQIDVQLKRRYDLIPNLVEVAKGYMAHERQTLENVIQARNAALNANGVKQKGEAENFLTSTLRSLFAVVENYPNLKADVQMRTLHEELTTTENKIAFARQYYNDEVMLLNTQLEVFPTNTFAGALGFKKEELFELKEETEKQAPKVNFNS